MKEEEYGAFVYKYGMLSAVNENSSTFSASISIFTATQLQMNRLNNKRTKTTNECSPLRLNNLTF